MLSYLRLPAVLMAGILATGFVGGCKDMMGKDKDMAMDAVDKNSLYARLGGKPAIEAVVNDFVGIAASDPAVNFTRTSPAHPRTWDATPDNVAKLKKHLVQFISMATGGPKTYEGQSMVSAHTGMQISDAEFGAIAGDLKKALTKNGVPTALQDELIGIVATTKGDIVNK